jgi:hypothetical protein
MVWHSLNIRLVQVAQIEESSLLKILEIALDFESKKLQALYKKFNNKLFFY